jgi:MoaA/NifB/PqqE/SkfB family radical SAM enzyme
LADLQVHQSSTPIAHQPVTMPEQRDTLPKILYIELADYCNLNCIFCNRGSYIAATGDKGGFIEFDMFRQLERPLRAAQYLGLSGRIGEPLLHPRLEQILRWVYEINPSILLRVTTNGTALGSKMAALLGGHLDSLSISLNASNAEAYFREMRPVGHRSANAGAWWNNLIRRITDFIAALPTTDCSRVRIITPVQRDNIDDVFDFVRLVARAGCSNAVITPMQVHDDSKIDMSVYWIKDKYNDVLDDASALAASLGVQLEAARFYTNPKPENIDLDSLCREPVETAYLNSAKPVLGGIAPCCHWIEESFTDDIYSDPAAFERLWNNDVYRRLRRKRDFKSCKACGIARPFDEVGFHFTPLLKKNLIASRRCAEAGAESSSYPDSELVRVCRSLSLDLRSLRRTVLGLGVSAERLDSIRSDGLDALPEIDRACWEAFLTTDLPPNDVDVALGGCFPGIGWFEPDNDSIARVSARWMGGGRSASVFLRLAPEHGYRIRTTAHHVRSAEMAERLHLTIAGFPRKVERDVQENGTSTLTILLPAELVRIYGGRIWLSIGYDGNSEGWVSFSRVEAIRLDALAMIRSRLQGDSMNAVGADLPQRRYGAGDVEKGRSPLVTN